MSKITDFSKLLTVIANLGVDLKDHLGKLEGGLPVESEGEFVAAPNGFYDILPTGQVVRLILHLGQGEASRCHDNPEAWHRFHMSRCAAYNAPNRHLRFFKTRRSDGRFTYFLYDHYGQEYRPEDRLRGRPLQICGHCRNKLIQLGLLGEYDQPNLSELLSGALTRRLFYERFKHDYDRISGFPMDDWIAIAKFAKHRNAYYCGRCGTDFSKLRLFLHAHYQEEDTHNDVLGRVHVLCAGCHALEKRHETLLQMVRSSNLFIDFRKAFPNHPAIS